MNNRYIYFIGRLQFKYRIDVIKEVPSNEGSKIKKQVIGYLYRTGHNNKTKHTYRVIHVNPDPKTDTRKEDKIKKGQALRKSKRAKNAGKTQEELYKEKLKEDIVLVTNIPSDVMSAEEIAEQYRERWNIEVFFRFIKQTVDFSHLVSRNKNGIISMMYIKLISAALLLAFRKLNNIKGYKDTKRALALVILKEFAMLTPERGPPLQ